MTHIDPTEIAILCIPVYSIPFWSCSLSTIYHPTETYQTFFFFLGRIFLCTSDVEFLSQVTLIQGLSWWDVILVWLCEYHPVLEIMFVVKPHIWKGKCYLQHCRKGLLVDKVINNNNLVEKCSILFIRSGYLPYPQKPKSVHARVRTSTDRKSVV